MKKNWIKELHTILEIHFVGRPTDFIKSETMIDKLVSDREKDAIEKTNKRWRERCNKLRNERGKLPDKADYEQDQTIGYNQALSDLLKEEK